jgi:hypothetical protein
VGEHIIRVADDFWNVRGSFKIAGVIDIGTHCSLLRRASGRFLMLDAYTLSGDIARQIDEITGGPAHVEAVLNLHPFHTVHVRAIHERYPEARHYGTARHLEKAPDLAWQPERIEDASTQALFEDDLEFSVPAGVDFIASNEHLHFSSVLALHRASKTLHVDDTIMYLRFPKLLKLFGLSESTGFHPTLAKVLERRAGAAADFRAWARGLADRWADAENLCAAHSATLLGARNTGDSIRDRILAALARVEPKLAAHEQKYG